MEQGKWALLALNTSKLIRLGYPEDKIKKEKKKFGNEVILKTKALSKRVSRWNFV